MKARTRQRATPWAHPRAAQHNTTTPRAQRRARARAAAGGAAGCFSASLIACLVRNLQEIATLEGNVVCVLGVRFFLIEDQPLSCATGLRCYAAFSYSGLAPLHLQTNPMVANCKESVAMATVAHRQIALIASPLAVEQAMLLVQAHACAPRATLASQHGAG